MLHTQTYLSKIGQPFLRLFANLSVIKAGIFLKPRGEDEQKSLYKVNDKLLGSAFNNLFNLGRVSQVAIKIQIRS